MIGLVATVIARQILIACRLAAQVRPAPVVYLCLMVCFTLTVWLIFFKN